MKKIVIYDYDGTLTVDPIPKFEILEKIGIVGGLLNLEFRKAMAEKSKNENIELFQASFELVFAAMRKAGLQLIDDNFCLGCEKMKYHQGVSEFLKMLVKNGVDNYLVSSGVKVFLQRITLADYFKDIYATTFIYNQKHEVQKVDFLMNDQNKVIAIKDILRRNGLQENDCTDVIYVGDGLTDYNAMQYVKSNGGTTIFVYTNPNDKNVSVMKGKNVVSYAARADYTKGSDLEKYIKNLCGINCL